MRAIARPERSDSGLAAGVAAPTVSVVIPTCNRPELLARAVASVYRQDYRGEIECIVVFDRHPVTEVPVEPRPRRMLRTIANERTPGLAGARNTGALAASGELLAFLDDDDLWLPAKVRRQVALLRSQDSAGVVACGIYVHRGRRRMRRVPQATLTYGDLLRSRHMEVNPCTLIVERSRFLTQIGLVDEDLPGAYAEDYEWLLRAAKDGDIMTVQEPLVEINWQRSSYFARDWHTIIAAQRYLLAKHPDFATDAAGFARISGQASFALAASGQREHARRWARTTVRLDPWQPRAYLALLVSAGMLRPETMLRLANALGRGV
jgi:glycosyltransferase involved in cell wall biosynthesis